MTALSLLTDHAYFIAPAPVTELINRLHPCGIEVPMWTPTQPIFNTDEVVGIYSQNRSV